MNPHTPGPWKILGDAPENLKSRYMIGSLCEKHGPGMANYVCHIKQERELNDGRQTQNAHLIAAAPDLLAALESCFSHLNQLAFIHNDKMSVDALKKAQQAISKAKGEA